MRLFLAQTDFDRLRNAGRTDARIISCEIGKANGDIDRKTAQPAIADEK